MVSVIIHLLLLVNLTVAVLSIQTVNKFGELDSVASNLDT